MSKKIGETNSLDRILMYIVFIVMGVVVSELVLIVVIFLWNIIVNLLNK